jgi:signal transduction histidine kinase
MREKELLTRANLDWLKMKYFSDPKRYIHLQKGDILLRENELNDKLYLVLDGALTGYLGFDSGHPFEAFRSAKDHFVGVYSFFSETHLSYSTVIAEKPTWLSYIDRYHAHHIDDEGRGFAEHFLPIVVDEIYTRQLLTQKMTISNQEAMRKLFQSEKMAMLGQLAAGLAHELNNAVGVIQRQTEWLADWTLRFVETNCDPIMLFFYRKGFEEGQPLSSSELRHRRKELEERFDMPSHIARQVAATGISNAELESLGSDNTEKLEQYLPFFDAGLAFHDMLAASGHASRVVRSVKELGVSGHEVKINTDLGQTIRESVLLLKDVLKGIQWKLELEEELSLQANPGELVQVWVNLIKNAGESIHGAGMRNGQISVKCKKEGATAFVEIADNGPGIPSDLMPRIFQPNVTTKVEGLSFGLGLGLSIVQRIIENMRGTIKVESKPGKTVFTVSIPLG